MQEEQLVIDNEGNIHYLSGHVDIGIIGNKTIERASNVEPCNRILRVFFHKTRKYFPSLANWTRKWKCKWQVVFVTTPDIAYGPFSKRETAIDFEVRMLQEIYF